MGPLKSGMPESVLIPAPVSTVTIGLAGTADVDDESAPILPILPAATIDLLDGAELLAAGAELPLVGRSPLSDAGSGCLGASGLIESRGGPRLAILDEEQPMDVLDGDRSLSHR